MKSSTSNAATRAAEVARTYAASHKALFIEEFIKIENPHKGEFIIPFKLWDNQKKLLSRLEHNRLTVVLKARQLGITWLTLAYIVTECIAKPNNVIMFSRTETEAKELIRRCEVEISHMTGLCAPLKDKDSAAVVRYEKSALELHLYLPDGFESRITAFPSASGAARSFTANILFFDEWAFQAGARAIWASAYPTVNSADGGNVKVIGVSTIERGTLFEELVLGAPDNGFALSFLPWNSDPSRNEEWYEATRRSMGDLIMQEYPATVEEAMTVPGGCYFSEVKEETHVREAQYGHEGKTLYYISIDYGLDMLSIKWIWVNTVGKCRVYREYDQSGLVISDAAKEINRYIPLDGKPEAIIAPPDLWGREQLTGRSRADIFAEYGVSFVKASNSLEDGCMALKQMLYPDGEPQLTFDECCRNVFGDLKKIQKDKNNPNVYAKTPHELTHSVDALRYFAVYWHNIPKEDKPVKTELEAYKERLERRGRRKLWR